MDWDTAIAQRLRRMPEPAMAPDFPDRLFAAVSGAPDRASPWRFAMAAALALGVGLGLWLDPGQGQAVTPVTVAVASGAVSPVRLVFRSPRALAGVTVSLRLPEGVELAGRDGRREWRWQTDLDRGGNVLELPVIVRAGEGGLITADVSYGQDRRQFAVLVRTRKSASFEVRPVETAAAPVSSLDPLEV